MRLSVATPAKDIESHEKTVLGGQKQDYERQTRLRKVSVVREEPCRQVARKYSALWSRSILNLWDFLVFNLTVQINPLRGMLLIAAWAKFFTHFFCYICGCKLYAMQRTDVSFTAEKVIDELGTFRPSLRQILVRNGNLPTLPHSVRMQWGPVELTVLIAYYCVRK